MSAERDPADLPADWPEAWPVPKVSLAAMLQELRRESARRVAVQIAMAKANMPKAPCEQQLAGALAMHRAARILENVSPYFEEVRALIHRLQQRGPR